MKRSTLLAVLALVAFLALVALPLISTALGAVQVYDLAWWTVDGGGDVSQADSYRLVGSAGQPDAGLMQAGDYSLAGGFLGGAAAQQLSQDSLFLPLLFR